MYAVRMRTLLPLLLLACKDDPAKTTDTDAAAPDLTEVLGEGEVRAGVITDEAALFGGVSAEGQVGDIKLYNSRVQFVIQGDRPSSYYIGYGGGLIDADVVRPAGQPGRDILDEFAVMAGLGRLLVPEQITVVRDGSDGQAAEVLVRGRGGPMTLITGTVENPDLIADLDAELTICYRLAPDSDLLEVTATVLWLDDDTPLQIGCFAMLSDDVSGPYHPGEGLDDGGSSAPPTWLGAVADRDEVALAIFPAETPFAASSLQQLLSSLGPFLAGFGESTIATDGQELVWHGYLGVGASLSELSGAWLATTGASAEDVAGTVTADGVPVAGARVHLLDSSGAPVTLARTDEAGRFSASVPAGTVTSAIATGRGSGQHFDQPAGAPWYSPLAAEVIREESLAALADGALPIPFAEGYGFSAAVPLSAGTDAVLELTPPGWLEVEVTDGLPAVVRVGFAGADPATGADGRLVPGRPDGLAAQAWLRAGRIPLEPGDYRVVLHRGLRDEPVVSEVTITSGETTTLRGAPERAYTPAGVLVIDPHSHAAPSADGGIPMSERLLTHAANGVDVHFGTDHDHVADYRVLLAPLGLEGTLASVVADEFSPVLRGHLNVYPLQAVPEANGGALLWWERQQDTPAWFAELRAWVGGGIIQSNHPLDSGLLAAAGYGLGTGIIGKPDFWSEDFDAMEVINDGSYQEPFLYYLDMVNRGLQPTPVGVSDSHGHRGGVGESVTFLHLGTSDVADYTDAALVTALKAHATVASHGPYIEATVDGTWAPGQTLSGPVSLDVAVYSPSWVPVDTLLLYENGTVIQEIPVTGAAPLRLETTLDLDPEADAAYVLVATSASRMAEVYPGSTSWAMTAAIRVDVGGDGWSAPWPAVSW